ncbi:MAG: hypothetical protein QXO32_02650 [Candidatus Bathyarchaeia archaeon]
MIKGSISKDLEELFRKEAMERYGYSKGAISKALEAAIKLWLRHDYKLSEEEVNNEAFESSVDELEDKHPGRYVVIEGGRVAKLCDSVEEALKLDPGSAYFHRLVFKAGEKPPLKVRLGWRAKLKPAGPT